MKLSLAVLYISLFIAVPAISQEKTNDSSDQATKLLLKRAEVCEGLKERETYNPGVVFSSGIGKIICFTDFDPVPKKTFIYHAYYFNDKLSARIKLTLNPPRWATFSRIQLRETDKGPWRVEISDKDENILHIIRFSIVD